MQSTIMSCPPTLYPFSAFNEKVAVRQCRFGQGCRGGKCPLQRTPKRGRQNGYRAPQYLPAEFETYPIIILFRILLTAVAPSLDPRFDGIRRQRISYSVRKDALYCLPCLLFSDATLRGEHWRANQANAFTTKGFCNWKKKYSAVLKHESSCAQECYCILGTCFAR